MSSTNAADTVATAANPKKRPLTKKMNRSNRAGLMMPVGRIDSLLKKSKFNRGRIGGKTSVYMAGVLQYIMEELLELSKTNGPQKKRDVGGSFRISKRHVMLAIESDAEFKSLFKNFCITGAGIMPTLKSHRVSDYKKEQLGLVFKPKETKEVEQEASTTKKAPKGTSDKNQPKMDPKKSTKTRPKSQTDNTPEHVLGDGEDSDQDDDFVHDD